MINFFKKLSIFGKIKAYFIKIIKLAIFIVKRIFFSFSRSFSKFIQKIGIQIRNFFKSQSFQVIKDFLNKRRKNFDNLNLRFIKFFHSKKVKERILFSNFLKSINSKKIKKNAKKEVNSNQKIGNFCFIDCQENAFQNERHFQFFCNDESNNFLNIQRFVEHYFFCLILKKKQKKIAIEQDCDFLKIFDFAFEIIECLFILMLQFIFLTIFSSLTICDKIIDIILEIDNKIESIFNNLFDQIDNLINLIEKKIDYISNRVIPKEFVFENFDCLMELNFMNFYLSL
jgi:hypothetical protein